MPSGLSAYNFVGIWFIKNKGSTHDAESTICGLHVAMEYLVRECTSLYLMSCCCTGVGSCTYVLLLLLLLHRGPVPLGGVAHVSCCCCTGVQCH